MTRNVAARPIPTRIDSIGYPGMPPGSSGNGGIVYVVVVLLDVVVAVVVVGIVVNAVWVEPIETVDVEVVDVVAEVVVLYLFWVTVVVRVFGIDTMLVEVLVTVPVKTVAHEVLVLVIDVVPM